MRQREREEKELSNCLSRRYDSWLSSAPRPSSAVSRLKHSRFTFVIQSLTLRRKDQRERPISKRSTTVSSSSPIRNLPTVTPIPSSKEARILSSRNIFFLIKLSYKFALSARAHVCVCVCVHEYARVCMRSRRDSARIVYRRTAQRIVDSKQRSVVFLSRENEDEGRRWNWICEGARVRTRARVIGN